MAAGCWASTWWERGSPKGHADADAAGVGGRVALVQGDLEALPVAADSVEGLGNSPASMHQPTVEAAIAGLGSRWFGASGSPASGRSTSWSTTLAT
jgi:hypothetical protein